MPTTPTIRRATPADADALCRIGRATFTETFGHLYPAQDLRAFLDEAHAPDAYARLAADDAYGLWLLEVDQEALGYAWAGPAGLPHPEIVAGDGELKRLYVLPRVQNGGWGSRLFETALQWLQRNGPRTLWIGVWSQNPGAQRLYRRYGFEKVGEYDFPVGRVLDREFILRRPASACA